MAAISAQAPRINFPRDETRGMRNWLGPQANLGRAPPAEFARVPIPAFTSRSAVAGAALPAMPPLLDGDRSGILANIRCPIKVCDMVIPPSDVVT
jgi:hypothetical protein